jgi:hypothetical protein
MYFRNSLLSARFPTKALYALLKPMGATGPVYLNLSLVVLKKEAAGHSEVLVICTTRHRVMSQKKRICINSAVRT